MKIKTSLSRAVIIHSFAHPTCGRVSCDSPHSSVHPARSASAHNASHSRCQNCRREGHFTRECKEPVVCVACGQEGHQRARDWWHTCLIHAQKVLYVELGGGRGPGGGAPGLVLASQGIRVDVNRSDERDSGILRQARRREIDGHGSPGAGQAPDTRVWKLEDGHDERVGRRATDDGSPGGDGRRKLKG
ncbi:hypothetical protein DFH09DRAFT_1094370 [Mycena vulgaris]|nr:hypothetical protein DFH09DRAFT_1094370 [Mycena vulgaris]